MRFYRIAFVGGMAIGYVLGAQAGRERYEQLKQLARKAAESPAMQQTAGALQAQASATARSAREQASASMRSAKAKTTAKVKSAKESATTGMRRNSARTARRQPTSEQAGKQAEVPGFGAVPASGRDDHRPFVPVNGNFGDHDVTS